MNLYRFFNPLGYETDKCVVIEAASFFEARSVYLDRYFPHRSEITHVDNFNRVIAITMQLAVQKLDDGVIIFRTISKFIVK